MRWTGMPFGMWGLFAGSFQKQLTAVLGYDAATARAITKKAKPKYKEIIAKLPKFEKGDRFQLNIIGCAMLGAFVLCMPKRPDAEALTVYYELLEVAMRQNDLAFEVRAYLKNHPCAAVVNLGCGLDNTGRACDNGRCKIYNLDFPDVIALRQQLLPAGEREQNIPCDLKDPAWFDKIDASGGAVFFASGVFYYFLTEQVRELVQGMADAFPGGVLVFDAANRTAVKMIAKTWLRTAKIKDVGAYFAVSDAPKEIGAWDNRLQVTSRGYMLGYNDLRDPSVSGFFRFLARLETTG